MATLDDLRSLEGVTAKLAQEFPGLPFSSYRIEARNASGDVLYSTMLRFRDDGTLFDSQEDGPTLASLVDPEEHAKRLNPPPPPEPTELLSPVEQRLYDALEALDSKATGPTILAALKSALKPPKTKP